MPLGDLLDEVLQLQLPQNRSGDPKATTNLRRRELVEHEVEEWIRAELAPAYPQWKVKGSNGKGAPAEVPWTRFFDPVLSPKPGEGWYVVYLFGATGESVFLTLMQGTTIWDTTRKDFNFRPPQQLIQRVDWAHSVLTQAGLAPAQFGAIDLHAKQKLGRVYQLATVHGIEYLRGAMPSEDQLRADVLQIGTMLDALYDIDDKTAYIPGDDAPEIVDAELAADASAGNSKRQRPNTRKRKSSGGQGFQLDQAEKEAIEQHAVSLATEYFVTLGYKVEYTGNKESYDLVATKGTEKLSVEVKGTVSPGEQVIVTYREVEHHLAHYPDNALVVVHSIDLDRTQTPPMAKGGVRVVHHPWKLDVAALTPISYKYTVPKP
ncbi:MrcB family domain-containing protein [Nocardia heshunensis]